MAAEHYFSQDPTSPLREHQVTMALGDRELTLVAPSGTFSPEGVDRGTQVLLDSAPPPHSHGVLVDLGCGWGPIALTLAEHSPEASVYAVDINRRALEAVGRNASLAGFGHIHPVTPDQFPELPIDTLWSNPPIRIGKQALYELLTTWLNRLAEEGEAWLVVAKQLGADSLQRWLNDGGAGEFQCERVETAKGYRVFRITRR